MPPPTTPLVFKRRPNSPIQAKLPFNSVSSFNKPENPSPVKTTISKLAADIPKKIVSTQSEDAPILTVNIFINYL
jgi:hypothetical protein